MGSPEWMKDYLATSHAPGTTFSKMMFLPAPSPKRVTVIVEDDDEITSYVFSGVDYVSTRTADYPYDEPETFSDILHHQPPKLALVDFRLSGFAKDEKGNVLTVIKRKRSDMLAS